MRDLVLMWAGGLAWLGLGFFLLNRTYNVIDIALWETVLGYALGGIFLIGGLAFTGMAAWATWPLDRE